MIAKRAGTRENTAVGIEPDPDVTGVTSNKTSMGSGTGKAGTNGHAFRKNPSWINSFVDSTKRLESPRVFRLWAAISVLGAAVEQRVWMISQGRKVYPNLYCGLVAHPGVGKTKTIHTARDYYMELAEPKLAPTTMTAASMIKALKASARTVMHMPEGTFTYNTMYVTADELTAFMHKYDEEAAGVMSHMYDVSVYRRTRVTDNIDIKIERPQLNLIIGTQPSMLMNYLPERAWEQGFCSRTIFVFSDERTIGDDFEQVDTALDANLTHDLLSISGLVGAFGITEGYRIAVNNWRALGEPPVPTHPKLLHYCTRRRMHLYKLSMVSAIDRSDVLLLTVDDFNRALTWLVEAEATMPDIFKAGAGNADARAMDEIYHFALTVGSQPIFKGGIPERKIMDHARQLVPLHTLDRLMKHMENTGLLVPTTAADYKTGQRKWRAANPHIEKPTDGEV